MTNADSQEEEIEVLLSIYDGDDNFKQIDSKTFQYKFGCEEDKATVLLEVQWPAEYPEVIPTFNLNTFYNQQLSSSAKTALGNALQEEGERNIGSQQTYTIIEWTRENFETVMSPYLNEDASAKLETLKLDDKDDTVSGDGLKAAKVKKEQLTKSQKRREWDRVDSKGEKPRGYNWMDVIKHLSQSGSGKQDAVEAQQETYLSAKNLPD